MHTTKQLSERCTGLLRTHLEPGELEIARGRCDYLRSIEGVPKGNGYTFLLVTSDRVMWTDYLGPERIYAERFSAIRSFSRGSYNHRWILLLRHGPSVRMEPSLRGGTGRPVGMLRPRRRRLNGRRQSSSSVGHRRLPPRPSWRDFTISIPEEGPLRFVERARPKPVVLTAVPESSVRSWIRWRRLRRFLRG